MKPTSKRSIANITNYRHKKILEMLYQRQSISADELATEFGVSKITIRRDLDALAGDHAVTVSHGFVRGDVARPVLPLRPRQ